MLSTTVALLSGCGQAAPAGSLPGGASTTRPSGPSPSAAPKAHADKAAFLEAVSAGSQDVDTATFVVNMEGPDGILRGSGTMTRESGVPVTHLQVHFGRPGTMSKALDAVVLRDEILVLGLAQDVEGPDWVRLTPGTELASMMRAIALWADRDVSAALLGRAATSVQHTDDSTYAVTLDGTRLTPAAGTSPVVLSVKLDAQDRVLRVAGSENGVEWSFTVKRFNDPVDVVVPEANQVSSLKGY